MPADLRAAAVWRAFGRGARLFALGAPPREMCFIAEGEVHLCRLSPDGTELVLQRARGSFLAEASVEADRYHCDAIAATPGRALVFPMREFRRGLAGCAVFRDQWMFHLMREVRKSRAQCERLGLRSARARILHYLETECPDGRLTLAGSKKAWAAELGLTHEALYRALARLVREGVIDVDERTVYRR
ncbi:Crp/Fnr family transcriptional regulator [Nitrogeniibacter mangrovi]|uniref:Crp/Fnr family transcriptional regulator n=1 Tax=Nitrogeniibacter mangrovi TaxID=2016596 RepID=A0A6C1B2L5_9RHOO|nr:Crp/Fnr family transcriptional regulator [Nitrogeniibacter mangrovi]QID16590.1 Crp/Fnr family transcriptional regulator [Nitrogeniibacter mangrovi]